jgi:diaminohydroxyphosphoribosylaminopyrimidine deaminase/5-amino-6-(5-phosphoribosylamino)uracil reductase
MVAGAGIQILRRARIRTEVGLLAEEAGRLIEPFATQITSGRPLVVSKVGMSLDGRIATASRRDRRITGPAAGDFTQGLRHQLDAVLVGIGTVLADDPQLTYRGNRRRARPLLRVVLDSHLRTPPAARVLRGAPEVPTLVFCSPDAAPARRRALEKRGAEIIAISRLQAGLSLSRALDELGSRKILGVLVEGGSEVHWSFVSSRRVDKFYFLIAPVILGGRKALPGVGGRGYNRIARAPRFEITRCFRSGVDLIVEAYPSYSRSIVSPWRS